MSGIGNNQPIRAQSSREEQAKAQREARDLRAASRASQREIPQSSQMTRVDDSVPRDMGESQRVEHEDHTQEIEISPTARVQFNFGSLSPRLPGHLSESHPSSFPRQGFPHHTAERAESRQSARAKRVLGPMSRDKREETIVPLLSTDRTIKSVMGEPGLLQGKSNQPAEIVDLSPLTPLTSVRTHPFLWLFCKVGGSEFLGVGKGSAFGIIDSRIRFEAPLRLVQ